MGVKWTVLLFVGTLLSCGSCMDWQGGGNFTQDNLTTLRSKIVAFNVPPSTYAAYAATLSTNLNTLWAPAWNVVIVFFSDSSNYDAVLYGYGFNGHWFWFNGVKTTYGYITYIIWKDYNCVGWIALNPPPSGFTTTSFGSTETNAITNTIQGGYASRDIGDIWLTAQGIQAKVPTASNTLLQDKLAYSVIAAQASSTLFFAKVCAKDFIILSGVGISGGSSTGTALILQMR